MPTGPHDGKDGPLQTVAQGGLTEGSRPIATGGLALIVRDRIVLPNHPNSPGFQTHPRKLTRGGRRAARFPSAPRARLAPAAVPSGNGTSAPTRRVAVGAGLDGGS